jgi:hypothetical protein
MYNFWIKLFLLILFINETHYYLQQINFFNDLTRLSFLINLNNVNTKIIINYVLPYLFPA